MSSLCGLRSTHRGSLRKRQSPYFHPNETKDEWGLVRNAAAIARTSIDTAHPWAREDQLSNIVEVESLRHTPTFEKTEAEALLRGNPVSPIKEETLSQGGTAESSSANKQQPAINRKPSFSKGPAARVKIVQQELRIQREERKKTRLYLERRKMDRSPVTPHFRPIQAPSGDLETIARIDASLKFEHFTTEDAWVLGSALRERLLGIPVPVVINIALANQNQTLFHTATHSGVTPDNDCWVARKRKTVLRFGVSTFYMHNKFQGDEIAFKEKYGLGNTAGEYAIHGGGVPIRVTGVEGVVAVVVVSGLKQDEDHAVIVEVIRDLYY